MSGYDSGYNGCNIISICILYKYYINILYTYYTYIYIYYVYIYIYIMYIYIYTMYIYIYYVYKICVCSIFSET